MSTATALKLSNPRQYAEVEDWPIGRDRRGTAIFEVETGRGGKQRVARTTTGKPKRTTYYNWILVVDGEDDRTYLIAETEFGQRVAIPGTLKGADYFYEDDEMYAAIGELRARFVGSGGIA